MQIPRGSAPLPLVSNHTERFDDASPPPDYCLPPPPCLSIHCAHSSRHNMIGAQHPKIGWPERGPCSRFEHVRLASGTNAFKCKPAPAKRDFARAAFLFYFFKLKYACSFLRRKGCSCMLATACITLICPLGGWLLFGPSLLQRGDSARKGHPV